MKNLFSVGELSKLQNISRQTLIFYDKIGLFCPAYVDPQNGYRYYSAAQLDSLDTICIMKKIGFSLDEIKTYLKEYTLDTSLVALRKQLTIIERQIQDLQVIKTASSTVACSWNSRPPSVTKSPMCQSKPPSSRASCCRKSPPPTPWKWSA